MNDYELILILNPDLSTKFDDFQKKFEKTLSDLKFKLHKLENIGRRQLAYSILNHNKGHYSIFKIEGPPEGALELESKLKYDNSIIRHLLLKLDSTSLEDSLLILESKDIKKTTNAEEQVEEKSKSKSKSKELEDNKIVDKPVLNEKSKDDE